ncbi:hypothetical protein OHC33_010241 [Knufia fluminis]|uniref:Glucose-methanol-choline oxidoreductase N-terminal domain-containing protein n=1 Tax=Knufia fluminis TaxID=191047 RepID=A0AAN8II67_9EURO|nr:hypothetical protein OHC33_010241 [Knufia fluminis]
MQDILLALTLAAGVLGQSSSTYVDSNTGITFQSFLDTSKDVFFGIALPTDTSDDVIGQIVGPADASWASFDFGSSMINNLLVVAWPYEGQVIASTRLTTGYTAPPEYIGSAAIKPISNGTFVNSTHFSYTYLCTGCAIESSSLRDNVGVFGWALSTTALTDASTTSATLTYHAAGFGAFGLDIDAARSDSFGSWAAMAASSNSTIPTIPKPPGSNSTLPVTTSNATYDYIIAGGGPAGIIVAQRLAETGADVLLIERGPASTYASGGEKVLDWNDTVTQYDVPALAYSLSSMDTDYCVDTASQAGCLLGGGTMVNAMMYVPPQPVDFDDKWPVGWKWTDVVASAERLYTKLPGTSVPSADGERYDQGAYDVLSKFFDGLGWSLTDIAESPDNKHNTYSHPHWSIGNGKRASPVTTYLPLAQSMPNFELQLETKVMRAVRNGSYVSGVEVETTAGNRQLINVNAGGKVILASGALSSPRILWNSGIGRSEQIQVVADGQTSVILPRESEWIDLPVGEGVQDHPIVTLKFQTGSLPALASAAFTNPSINDTEMFAQGEGLLTQSGQRLNFWSSAEASDGATRYFQGTCNAPSNNTVQMKIYLTHGLTSSGDLTITSAGNTEFAVQPWLNTDADREALATFIDQLLEYTRTSNSSLRYTSSTGTNDTGASLLDTFVSGSHFVGTARMGSDEGSVVVDTDTKVYGTDNLYVVDASIHPDLPTGNTQAIVMVAAEHAADKILAASVNGTEATPSSKFTTSRVIRTGFTNSYSQKQRKRHMHLPRAGRRSMLRSGLRSF